MGHMIDATSTSRPAAVAAAGPEQLTLLPTPSTPARFRLSRDTRERGLRHVAEIRAMLDQRRTADAEIRMLRAPHDRAA